jgi:hypothetical protein
MMWGCTGEGRTDHAEVLGVNVCPSTSADEASSALGFTEHEAIQLQGLLARASDSGFSVETTTLRLRATQCINRPSDESMTIYVIHAGFDASQSYSRHFVVIPGAGGGVSDIEVQRAYVAP